MSILMVPFSKIPAPAHIEVIPNHGMYVHLTPEGQEFCEKYSQLQSEFSDKTLDNIRIGRLIEYGYCVALAYAAKLWPDLEIQLLHNPFRSSYGETGELHNKDDIRLNFGRPRYTQLECKGTRCRFIQNVHTREGMKFFFANKTVYAIFVFGFVPAEMKDRNIIYLAGASTPKRLHESSFFMCCGDTLSEEKGITLERSTYAVKQGSLMPFNKATLEDLKYCRSF